MRKVWRDIADMDPQESFLHFATTKLRLIIPGMSLPPYHRIS